MMTTNNVRANIVSLISRRHPHYDELLGEWELFYHSYLNKRAYVDLNLFRFHKEGDREYAARLERAYRENHSKRIVDLINAYLFKEGVTRKTDNARLKKWISNVNGAGRPLNKFMKLASQWSSVMGRIYIVVDKKSLPEDEKTGTMMDNLNPKAMPYLYCVMPQDMLDIAFDDAGRVKWCLVREVYRDDDDPFDAAEDESERYRLWTGGEWFLYDAEGKEIGYGETGLPGPPVVILDNEEIDQYSGQSMLGDIAYLDRAIFNNWSRLDAIVCDQTFSQLIFPIEGLPPEIVEDRQLREKFLTLATNRILLYSAMAQTPPQWISPDASQAAFILDMTLKLTKQLYAKVGMQAETAEEVKTQSGVAKAYDFDKLNSLLAAKADNLEQAEISIIELVKQWMGDTGATIEIDYPDEFDVRGLMDEIALAESLSVLAISQTFLKEIEKQIAAKALPKAGDDTMKKIFEEIDQKPEDIMGTMTNIGLRGKDAEREY